MPDPVRRRALLAAVLAAVLAAALDARSRGSA
jgi:hypothetical protein